MATSSESDSSISTRQPEAGTRGWVKVGVIAAATALAGGLAAALWYRHTLKKLRQTGENPPDTQFGMQMDDPSEED